MVCFCLVHVLVAEVAERHVLVIRQADRAPARRTQLVGSVDVIHDRGRIGSHERTGLVVEADRTVSLETEDVVVALARAWVLYVARLLCCQKASLIQPDKVRHLAVRASLAAHMVVIRWDVRERSRCRIRARIALRDSVRHLLDRRRGAQQAEEIPERGHGDFRETLEWRPGRASILCKKRLWGFVFLCLVRGCDGFLEVFIGSAQVLASEQNLVL